MFVRHLDQADINELSKTQGVVNIGISENSKGIYQISTHDGFPKTFDYIQFYWEVLPNGFVLKMKDWKENGTNLNVGDFITVIQ